MSLCWLFRHSILYGEIHWPLAVFSPFHRYSTWTVLSQALSPLGHVEGTGYWTSIQLDVDPIGRQFTSLIEQCHTHPSWTLNMYLAGRIQTSHRRQLRYPQLPFDRRQMARSGSAVSIESLWRSRLLTPGRMSNFMR